MGNILLKSGCFVFLIALGYFLKRKGFFGPLDYKIPVKMVLNITMPCAVIVSFAAYQPDFSLLLAACMGLGANCLLMVLGYFISRKQPRATRAVWLNCAPCYNIGAFAMPFVQSFLSPGALMGTCMFDLGNALICNGTSYAISLNILDKTKGLNLKRIAKTLLTSVPFVSYMIMLALTLFSISIPEPVVTFVTPIANANAFLAMLMVGMMLDLNIEKALFKEVAGIVAVRFSVAVAVALMSYYLLPLPLEIRQAIAITGFAPIGMMATALTPSAGGDPAIAACANSVSIILSVACMIGLSIVFGAL